MTRHAYAGKGMAMSTFGFLLASSLGALIGVLFAPQPGRETRQKLAQKARQATWTLKKDSAKARETLQNIFGRVNEDLEDIYMQMRNEIQEQLDELGEYEGTPQMYQSIIDDVVSMAVRGKRWTQDQINALKRELEDEYMNEQR